MKKVEFVRVSSTLSGFGPFKGTKYTFEGAEEIIRKRIEDGWEYSGYVPIDTRGLGDTEAISLVFQKDE